MAGALTSQLAELQAAQKVTQVYALVTAFQLYYVQSWLHGWFSKFSPLPARCAASCIA